MDKSEIKGFIAKRCAKELKNGDVVNLGIGLPTMIPRYLPEGVELVIHAELGIVGAGANPKEGDANYLPYHVTDAGGAPASVAFDGSFADSATNFGLIRGGHVDACFLGALEVDMEGNLANWIIPGKKMPGHLGAEQVTVQNLEVVKVDAEANMIAIRGAVPGPKGSLVFIKNTVKNIKVKQADTGISKNPQKASGRNPQKASARS